MAPLLQDKNIAQFDVLAIQEPWYNVYNRSSFNPSSSGFYLAYRPEPDTRTCFYVNKRLDLTSWEIKYNGGDLCSLRLEIYVNSIGVEKEIWIHNVYNPSSVTYASMDSPSTLSKLEQALGKARDHVLVGDFNLHHPQWNNLGPFTYHLAADALISITQQKDMSLVST